MSFVDKDGMLAEPTQNGDGVHFSGVEAEGFVAGLQELYNSGVDDGIVQVNTMDWGGGGDPGINLKYLTQNQAIDALVIAANCVEYAYQINKNPISNQVRGNLGFEINNYQGKLKSENAKKEFAVIVENYFISFTSTRFFDKNSLSLMKMILQSNTLSPSERVNYVNQLIDNTLQEWQPISALGVTAGFAFLGYGMGGSLAIGKQLPKPKSPTVPGTNWRTHLPTSSLTPTHLITMSKTKMQALLNDIRINGINESIKYVEQNGVKYIVDGHHRFYAAQRLGIQNVPVQQVQLPYLGYKKATDLMMEPGKQPGFLKFLQ